jgi:hypothetical protein
MTLVRPTPEELYADVKAWKANRKPSFAKPKGNWTFASAAQLCTVANLPLHADAEAHWNTQTVSPSWRTMLLADNRKPAVQNIVSGVTSGIAATPEQKAASNAKRSAANKKLNDADPGSRHWKEAASISETMRRFIAVHPEFEWRPLPDGLGADIVIRRKGAGDSAWVAVQVKSGIAHPGGRVNFHIERQDGVEGARYEVSFK